MLTDGFLLLLALVAIASIIWKVSVGGALAAIIGAGIGYLFGRRRRR